MVRKPSKCPLLGVGFSVILASSYAECRSLLTWHAVGASHEPCRGWGLGVRSHYFRATQVMGRWPGSSLCRNRINLGIMGDKIFFASIKNYVLSCSYWQWCRVDCSPPAVASCPLGIRVQCCSISSRVSREVGCVLLCSMEGSWF